MQIPLLLDRSRSETLTTQLVDQLREAIRRGRIPTGARLPSSRVLADERNRTPPLKQTGGGTMLNHTDAHRDCSRSEIGELRAGAVAANPGVGPVGNLALVVGNIRAPGSGTTAVLVW